MKSVVSAILVSCGVFSLVQCVPLPSEFKPCHAADTNFLECLGTNIEAAIKSLKNGNALLKVPSLDPIELSAAVIGRGSGTVDVAQNYSNIRLHGASIVDYAKVIKANVDDFELEFELFNPNIRWEAKYRSSGRILLLPIYGDGDANITMFNTISTHNLKGKLFTKKGEKYLKVSSYDLKLKPEKVSFKFENLFNGNKLLGDNMNQVMNDNWKDLFDDVKSGYEEVIGAVFLSFANSVFSRIPYKEIFL